MVVTVPVSSLLEVVTSQPRQSVPASDGSDYLKTTALHRYGPGARIDAPGSYISLESFDLLMLTKGSQTVLWVATLQEQFISNARSRVLIKRGLQGSARLLAASYNR